MDNGVAINIFDYFDFRMYLRDFIESRLHRKGFSYRSFSKKCKFSSPNYFQRLIAERRKLSAKAVEQIIVGFNLDETSAHYFRLMVQLENEKGEEERHALQKKLEQFSKFSDTKMIVDQRARCHWLVGVIWEMIACTNLNLDGENLVEKFNHIASQSDIEFCTKFLLDSGYISLSKDKCFELVENIQFAAVNDKRNFDVRKSHLSFLNLAKLRINDALNEREYQGLNIAIPMSRFPELQARLRAAIQEINSEFSDDPDAETVVRVQISAFKVSR